MKRFRAFTAALFSVLVSHGMAMPVPAEVKAVVVFVFMAGPGDVPVPQGTGFLVSINDTATPGRVFGYLVTAKHVLQTDDQKTFRPEIFLRLNVIGGGSEFAKIPLFPEGKGKNVF